MVGSVIILTCLSWHVFWAVNLQSSDSCHLPNLRRGMLQVHVLHVCSFISVVLTTHNYSESGIITYFLIPSLPPPSTVCSTIHSNVCWPTILRVPAQSHKSLRKSQSRCRLCCSSTRTEACSGPEGREKIPSMLWWDSAMEMTSECVCECVCV